MIDKWRELRSWEGLPNHVARKMDELEIQQRNEAPDVKHEEGFLFTGVPKFDPKAWEEIMKDHLQGLS